MLLEGVSFAAADSETLCIIGRKGSGKTLLLKALMGIVPLEKGHVSIDGELLSPASAMEFRRHIISYVPQSPEMEMFTVDGLARHLFALAANKGRAFTRALLMEEMRQLGLEDDRYERQFAELTLAERQLALLAIVCFQNKPIVLVDEPAAGLDVQGLSLVAAYIRRRADRGQTVVVTSSDDTLGEMCHKHYELK